MTPMQVGTLILDVALVATTVWLLFRIKRIEAQMRNEGDPWWNDHA